ncbi:hypothetical protein DSO57_1035115 [Entomophthora muscae]|uniref:Uncharacterized protein n=1 Tax=Entomophthora muscae TaxID=34485 RepID=A0ACC2SNV9_9FUNG|nr:hypothetical protein DSO57_1035115 [Entomophthora muscae]
MGCCGSKQATQEPNESTSLLNSSHIITEAPVGQPQMDAQHYTAEILAQETATLNQIVQKTAENLIDISRIHSVERVRLHDAATRSEEYLSLINNSTRLQEESKQPRLSQLFNIPTSGPITPAESDPDVFPTLLGLATSPGTRDSVDQFTQISKELVTRLDQIQIDSTEDFVVPLTFSSTPIQHNP